MTSAQVREMVEPHIRAILPEGWMTRRDQLAREPDGEIRDRRTGR